MKTETFLAQLFLAYELCPPTQTAINKKLEQLDTTSMNIEETHNAIIRICGELLRDLEHLLDEMVFDILKDALPSTLSHLLGAMESPIQGFPNQRDILQFISQHKDYIDEINARYNQMKQEEQTKHRNSQHF